jgi:hypothetical protein
VPTQRCIPQGGDFTEYAIAHFKNYLFEIDGETARVTRHLAIPKDLPGALTSDVDGAAAGRLAARLTGLFADPDRLA